MNWGEMKAEAAWRKIPDWEQVMIDGARVTGLSEGNAECVLEAEGPEERIEAEVAERVALLLGEDRGGQGRARGPVVTPGLPLDIAAIERRVKALAGWAYGAEEAQAIQCDIPALIAALRASEAEVLALRGEGRALETAAMALLDKMALIHADERYKDELAALRAALGGQGAAAEAGAGSGGAL